jgi:hypothetical protein
LGSRGDDDPPFWESPDRFLKVACVDFAPSPFSTANLEYDIVCQTRVLVSVNESRISSTPREFPASYPATTITVHSKALDQPTGQPQPSPNSLLVTGRLTGNANILWPTPGKA